MTSLLLIGCSARKAKDPCPARDLYQGPLFKKARAYAEVVGEPWAILSALHGLVDPEVVLEPYEYRLPHYRSTGRVAWARAVADEVVCRFAPQRVTLLAGADYADALSPNLQVRGIKVERPLQGLGIGQQMRWLDRQYASRYPLSAEKLAELARTHRPPQSWYDATDKPF